MSRPKGPLACWTDRQLGWEQGRISATLRQLCKGARKKMPLASATVPMWPGWKPTKGQRFVYPFFAIRGSLIHVFRAPKDRPLIQVGFVQGTARVTLMLQLGGIADEFDVRAGKPSTIHRSTLPPLTPEQAAWMERTRAANEAAQALLVKRGIWLAE